MDTLIKVTVKKYKFNSLEISESVAFYATSYSNINWSDNLFSFKEYEEIEILFESNLDNSYLKVESYESEEVVNLKSGESIKLSPGGDTDNMLSPGFYTIDLIIGVNEYKGFYSITPNSVDYESLLKMKEILNDMCKGLSNNIYSERSGLEYLSADSLNIDLVTFNYIEASYRELVSAMTSIIKNPIENLVKSYGHRNNSTRPDIKSIRWNNKKGYSTGNSVYNEKHCILTLDTAENRLLKALCEKILYAISYIERKLKGHLLFLKSKKEDIEGNIKELNNQKYKLTFLNNVDKRKWEVKRDIENNTLDIEKLSLKIEKLVSSIRRTTYCKNTLITFLEQDWVSNLSSARQVIPTKKFFKRLDYVFFYNMYISMLEKGNDNKIGTVFSSKKTSLMYEVYSVINTIKALEDIGFIWESGWIKSIDSLSTFNGDLESGEKIILRKDEYKIELTYDYTIERASNIRGKNSSQLVSSNSNRRKPDILLSLFKNNKFIKSMIIEVKYRKETYIYNVNGETDVIHQLKEYRNLDYYDGELKKVSDLRPIQKVVVVYPNAKEKKFEDEIYGFTFISLMPNKDKETIGYNLLRNELSNFIG